MRMGFGGVDSCETYFRNGLIARQEGERTGIELQSYCHVKVKDLDDLRTFFTSSDSHCKVNNCEIYSCTPISVARHEM